MYRLFPPQTEASDLAVDEVYTVPELAFPSGPVPLPDGGLRPYVYFNMVASMDGKAITEDRNAAGLGSGIDFQIMGRLRLAGDAVLVGAETFRRDPFVPSTRPNLVGERARYFPSTPHPIGVTLSRDGNLPLDKNFFKGELKYRVVFLGPAAPADRALALAGQSQVFRLDQLPNGELDLKQMLSILHDELGVEHLLCEGGPTLNFALLKQGFGDEFFWTLAPKIVGGSTNITIVKGPGLGLPLENLVKLRLISIYEQTSELFMRYKIEY